MRPDHRTYHLTTFGCQMNEHDSERMKGMLESLGYSEAADREGADLILFNTCSIREKADNRLVGHLGEAKRLKSEDPELKRMLGATPGMGKALGLDEKWVYNAVKSVGNYGQIFERNVGDKSPLKLDRGPNDLWTRGGLMYAIPIR